MKRIFLVIMVTFLLLLAGCTPTAESEPQLTASEETARQPLPAPQTPRSVITAEEVLPPVTKNIFTDRRDDIYCSGISTSIDGFMVILSDGSLEAFGETMGGDGSFERDESSGYYKTTHVLDNISYVHCSQFNTLAVDKDGILWGKVAWGNLTGEQSTRMIRLMTDVQMASAGSNSYLALRRDGTVWMWGGGEYGLLGNGPEFMKYSATAPLLDPVQALEDVICAELNGATCYAIKEDHSLWAWGYMGQDPKTGDAVIYDRPVHIMDDVRYAYGIFILKTDGTLWVLDADAYYGDYDSGWSFYYDSFYYDGKPAQIMEDVKLARGAGRFLVVKNDGSLWVWGDNSGGALGIGTDEYVNEPTKIMDNVVDAISSYTNVYALKSNGELWELGTQHGIFDFSSESKHIPTQEELFASRLPHKVLENVSVRPYGAAGGGQGNGGSDSAAN